MTLVCHGYKPEVSEWLNIFRTAFVHKGVRCKSISFEIRSVELLLPFFRFFIALSNSGVVMGSLSKPRSGCVGNCLGLCLERSRSLSGFL